jgi:hypothetical protein
VKIRNLDIGLESYTQVGPGEDVHLPREGALGPRFIPRPGHLDAVLKRPSLDERLPALLQPRIVSEDLLQPAVLAETRRATHALLREAARRATGHRRRLLDQAATFLDEDADLDEEVRTALAALLKG